MLLEKCAFPESLETFQKQQQMTAWPYYYFTSKHFAFQIVPNVWKGNRNVKSNWVK